MPTRRRVHGLHGSALLGGAYLGGAVRHAVPTTVKAAVKAAPKAALAGAVTKEQLMHAVPQKKLEAIVVRNVNAHRRR